MHLRLLCLVLVAVALSLFVYRWQVLNYPVLPDADSSVWEIEAQIDVEGTGEEARIGLFVPPKAGRFGALEEDFTSSGLALTIRTDAVRNRSAVWSTGELVGRSSVFYRALFYRLPQNQVSDAVTTPPAELPERLRFPPPRDEAQRAAAEQLAARIDADAADTGSRVSLLLDRLNDPGAGSNGGALLPDEADAADVAAVAAFVLASDAISARVVHGLPLEDSRQSVSPGAWLEVWNGERWRSFDVASGDPFEPVNHLVWWRGPSDLVSIDGAELRRTSFALQQQQVGAVAALERRSALMSDPLASATLLALPVNTQNVFRILLMIPVGALLLVFLRQVVGVETLGTFMPVLIALAFRVTDLVYGVLFFTLLVTAGLLVRAYFARLNLLLVPRLAAMLVVVILLMIGMSLLADAVSLGLGLSVALFPIVILTMTIERMSVTWEENGPADAIKQGVGSLVVAVLAYAAMNLAWLEHLLFVFPELSLVILAAMLLLGRYSGYRLSELRRFRQLATEVR
jgi:hypothetical protein